MENTQNTANTKESLTKEIKEISQTSHPVSQLTSVRVDANGRDKATDTLSRLGGTVGDRQTERPADEADLEEIIIKIKRVTKVVKGGKRMGFSALVSVGDRHGQVGYGKGSANEVPFAVTKAVKQAKKSLIRVPMKNTTLPHRVRGKYGATKVIIRPACPGTGIIAGSTVRAILELLGVKDILAKVMGSTNPTNVVKATINALKTVKSYKERKLLLKS